MALVATLAVILAVLVIVLNFLWAYSNVRFALSLNAVTNGFDLMRKINDEIDGRVKARVKVVNREVATGAIASNLPPGQLESYGTDLLVEEQPPIRQTDILDEVHEINREIARYQRPGTTYNKRDEFGPEYEEA